MPKVKQVYNVDMTKLLAVGAAARIAALEEEIAGIRLLVPVPPAVRIRRGISAAGRARIAAAQRRRWAKVKKAKAA